MGKRGRRRQQAIPDQPNGLDRIFVWDIDGSLVRADTVSNSHEPSVLASVADKLGALSKRLKELTLEFCDDRLFLHELELSDQMHIDDVPSDHQQHLQHHNHSQHHLQQQQQQQQVYQAKQDAADELARPPAKLDGALAGLDFHQPSREAPAAIAFESYQETATGLSVSVAASLATADNNQPLGSHNQDHHHHQQHHHLSSSEQISSATASENHYANNADPLGNHQQAQAALVHNPDYNHPLQLQAQFQQDQDQYLNSGSSGNNNNNNNHHQHHHHHHQHGHSHLVHHQAHPDQQYLDNNSLQQQQQQRVYHSNGRQDENMFQDHQQADENNHNHSNNHQQQHNHQHQNHHHHHHQQQQQRQLNHQHELPQSTGQEPAESQQQKQHHLSDILHASQHIRDVTAHSENNNSYSRVSSDGSTIIADPSPELVTGRQQQSMANSYLLAGQSNSVESDSQTNLLALGSEHMKQFDGPVDGANFHQLRAEMPVAEEAYESYGTAAVLPAQAAQDSQQLGGQLLNDEQGLQMVPSVTAASAAAASAAAAGHYHAGSNSGSTDTLGAQHSVPALLGSHHSDYGHQLHQQAQYQDDHYHNAHPHNHHHHHHHGHSHLVHHHHSLHGYQDAHHHLHPMLSHQQHQVQQQLYSLDPLVQHYHQQRQQQQQQQQQFGQHHNHNHNHHHHHHHPTQLHHSHNPTQLVEFLHHQQQQQPHFLGQQQQLSNGSQHAHHQHLHHHHHQQPDLQESHYIQQHQHQHHLHHGHHHHHQQQQQELQQRYHNLDSKLYHDRHFASANLVHQQQDQDEQQQQQQQQQQQHQLLHHQQDLAQPNSTGVLSIDGNSVKLDSNNNHSNNSDERNVAALGFATGNTIAQVATTTSTTVSAATATLRTVLNNHHKQLTQRLSVRFQKIRAVYGQYRNGLPSATCANSASTTVTLVETTTVTAASNTTNAAAAATTIDAGTTNAAAIMSKPTNNENSQSLVKLASDLNEILAEIDHYTLDWRKRAMDCLKLISESNNCTNIIITRMPLVIALGHLICLGFSQFFDIDQVYSASKTSKEACLKRVRKRFETTNRCSYIIVGDKEDEAMAKRLDLPCWNTSRSDGHRQLVQLYTALKEGYLM